MKSAVSAICLHTLLSYLLTDWSVCIMGFKSHSPKSFPSPHPLLPKIMTKFYKSCNCTLCLFCDWLKALTQECNVEGSWYSFGRGGGHIGALNRTKYTNYYIEPFVFFQNIFYIFDPIPLRCARVLSILAVNCKTVILLPLYLNREIIPHQTTYILKYILKQYIETIKL